MNIEMENGTQMTLDQFVPMKSQEQTVGVSDFPVRTSVSPENKKDSMDTVHLCFSQLQGLLETSKKKIDPSTYLLRTLKTYLVLTGGGGDFLKLLIELDEIGYDAEWQLLNSKDFGVPQNRERVFIIGHLRGRSTGKVFPVDGTSTENSIYQLGKVFRPNRDNPNAGRTYGVKGIAPCLGTMEGGKERPQHERIYDTNGVMTALNSQLGGRHNIAVPINIEEDMILDGNNFNQRKVVHGNGSISRTLIGCGHSGNEPKVAIPILTPDRAEKRQNGRRFKENGKPMFTLAAQDRHGVGIGVRYTENGFHLYRKDKKKSTIQGTHVTCQNGNVQCLGTSHIPMTMEKIGIIDPQGRNNKEVFPEDICPTLRSETHGNVPNVCVNIHETSNYGNGIYVEMPEGFIVYAIWYEKEHCYITIRKLTPKECFRLQGWTDDYFERAAFVNSDSRLYMQAGNGVTVDVVYAIGKRILCA